MKSKLIFAYMAPLLIVELISFKSFNGRPFVIKAWRSLPSDSVTFSVDSVASGGKFPGKFVYYHDSLYKSHGITIQSRNTKCLLNAPQLLFEANATQTPYLVYPGEKINIRYIGTDSMQMYIPGNIERSNELNFFRKLVLTTGNLWYFLPSMPYHKSVNNIGQVHELESVIHNLKARRLKFLISYHRQFPVSEGFIKIAANCIEFTAVSDSLLLYHMNRAMLVKQNIYKPMVLAKVATINRIGYTPYATCFRACVDLVSMAVGTNAFDINGIGGNNRQFIDAFNFAEKNFHGEIKDFLMAKALYSADESKVPIPKTYFSKFNAACTDKTYRDLINTQLDHNKRSVLYTKGYNKLLTVDGQSVQNFNNVIARHKGKLILLDFWASWCAPCREEMPYSAKLKEKYKGKNIVFLTISTDEDVNGWQKASKQEALDSKYNFLLINANKTPFVKRYNINSIPRYIVIGKDGKVLNADAPRPSDQKLQKLIDRSL